MAIKENPSPSFLQGVTLAVDNQSVEQNDPFWDHATIESSRWNAVFPYQLLVVKREDGGGYSVPGGGGSNENFSAFGGSGSDWNFTFPFPPESISISTPFAISGMVTQGGYVEEHGGAPIKQISFSGTLGVFPLRPAAATRATSNIAEAIFGGTVQQVQDTATSARALASNFGSSNTNFKPNLVSETDMQEGSDLSKSTGYYQMRLLAEFFENYASFKKKKRERSLPPSALSLEGPERIPCHPAWLQHEQDCWVSL